MPAFVPLIAAGVAAAATIYATEASRGKGAKAPAPGFGGGGDKGGIVTPDVFGQKEKTTPLLGGQKQGLAQALEGSTPQPPAYGPTIDPSFLEQEQQRAWLKNLMTRGI